MNAERPKDGDVVRPIGWRQKMMVVGPAVAAPGVEDGVRCRWRDQDGPHEEVFSAQQLEIVKTRAQLRDRPRRTIFLRRWLVRG